MRKNPNRLQQIGLLLALTFVAVRAEATQFVITIKNTSNAAWSQGLLSLSPLLALGPVPITSDPAYAAYAYATSSCTMSDATCSSSTCEDGNASLLAQRSGLTLGTDAWLVPALAVGASATVAIDATAGTPQPRVSYLARAGSGDDFVAIHRTGDPTTLSSDALFDSAGMPLMNVGFEIGGYNADASDSSDGSAGACTPTCGDSSPGCYIASGNSSTGGTLEAQPTLFDLSNPWTYSPPSPIYQSDGLALGRVAGTGAETGDALVVVMNGAVVTWDTAQRGRAVVLSSLGSASPSIYNFDALTDQHDFMGFPTIMNLGSSTVPATGDGQFLVPEYAARSQSPGASVHARSNDSSTATWTLYGLDYPGLWNMGSSTGELRTDTGNDGEEVVIPNWSGDLVVVKRDTAETLNSYDFYTEQSGETLYGHVAVADVLPASGNELVVYGGTSGTVYVMGVSQTDASMTPLWQSVPAAGLYGYGSGPTVADLDGDGQPEIVIAAPDTNKVYAYDPQYGTGCKYQWTIPDSAGYMMTSAVVGDVDDDGTGDKEVVVFSTNGLLSVLGLSGTIPTDGVTCADGEVKWSYTVGSGGASSFVPALADLTGNGALDIVVATFTTLEVVDAQARQVAYRYNDPTATFWQAVVEGRSSGTTAPAASIYASGWVNGKVYRLTTPAEAKVPSADWTSFMGGNTRTGAR